MDTLLIFIKNPQLGKVKTRIAATLGDEKALDIYRQLLAYTRNLTQTLPVDKNLFYSDFIDEDDIFPDDAYHKHLQTQTPDLGKKMYDAFTLLLPEGYLKMMIIGSDCIELTGDILKQAYDQLSENEAVIGPANDGGYYALGFNFSAMAEPDALLQQLFLGKKWSHESVFQEAKDILDAQGVSTYLLPALNDIDNAEDAKELL